MHYRTTQHCTRGRGQPTVTPTAVVYGMAAIAPVMLPSQSPMPLLIMRCLALCVRWPGGRGML